MCHLNIARRGSCHVWAVLGRMKLSPLFVLDKNLARYGARNWRFISWWRSHVTDMDIAWPWSTYYIIRYMPLSFDSLLLASPRYSTRNWKLLSNEGGRGGYLLFPVRLTNYRAHFPIWCLHGHVETFGTNNLNQSGDIVLVLLLRCFQIDRTRTP